MSPRLTYFSLPFFLRSLRARDYTALFRPGTSFSTYKRKGYHTLFKVVSPFTPQGDQPEAIEKLSEGVLRGDKLQVLLGVTGSGKTYTMAKVIERVQKPTLVLAHNKTLAAQLCSELKGFFPDSAVEYFVSYYDYYQPEAYIASSDTYIEKTTAVNEEIDRLRHSATCALNERKDVIIVASVSCIYALGDPEEYLHLSLSLRPGMEVSREEVMRKLVDIQFQRNDLDFQRGTFRVRGDTLDIFPMGNEGQAIRVSFFGDEIEKITEINTLTGEVLSRQDHAAIFPASHYATGQAKLMAAMNEIEGDMELRRDQFLDENKPLEAERIEQRALHADRLLPQGLFAHHRREPRDHPPDRRHVPGGPDAQGGAGEVRLPSPLRLRQPAAAVRRVSIPHPPDALRVGHAGALGALPLHPGGGTDHPAHGPR